MQRRRLVDGEAVIVSGKLPQEAIGSGGLKAAGGGGGAGGGGAAGGRSSLGVLGGGPKNSMRAKVRPKVSV